MIDPSTQKKIDAQKALVNIAILEGIMLAVVFTVFFYTNNVAYLIGGIAGVVMIFTPMFFGWVRKHSAAMRAENKT